MKSQPLAQRIGVDLRARGLTLAVAELCTGGLLGDLITDIPGSSDYFLGGVLSYSNRIKQGLLGVQAETLAAQGAVSAQCAAEMAQGVRRLMQSDVALSVTGIAGPGGGSDGKPKGLTFIHLSAPGCEQGMRCIWPGDRRANKLDFALAALGLLLEYLHRTTPPLADAKEEEHG
ncbi:MAG: CinA family protein [Anaerolineae bacterium]